MYAVCNFDIKNSYPNAVCAPRQKKKLPLN